MGLKIGEKFRYNENGYCYNALLIYDMLDECNPYRVVNTSNYEVMEAYESVEKIPVFDVVAEVASKILLYKDSNLRYIDSSSGAFKISFIVGQSTNPVETKSLCEINDCSTLEKEKLLSLCLAFGITRLEGGGRSF